MATVRGQPDGPTPMNRGSVSKYWNSWRTTMLQLYVELWSLTEQLNTRSFTKWILVQLWRMCIKVFRGTTKWKFRMWKHQNCSTINPMWHNWLPGVSLVIDSRCFRLFLPELMTQSISACQFKNENVKNQNCLLIRNTWSRKKGGLRSNKLHVFASTLVWNTTGSECIKYCYYNIHTNTQIYSSTVQES